jgi:hypothetical protein
MIIAADVQGTMLFSLSEMMAVFPYFLRSIRIKRMFDCREIYWQTDRMPKEIIRNWNEARILTIFLVQLGVSSGLYMAMAYVYGTLPNYNSMGVKIDQWYNVHPNDDAQMSMQAQYSIDNTLICVGSFLEYTMLFLALYTQWNVESDYNIFREVFWITLTFLLCNSCINFIRILNGTIITNGEYLPVNSLQYWNFAFIVIRSAVCILISTCKNVYDTFVIDQMVLRPPDENALDDLEMILHNTSALEYFYDYLKQKDEENKQVYLFTPGFNSNERTPRPSDGTTDEQMIIHNTSS